MPGAPNPASPPGQIGTLSPLAVAQLALQAGFTPDQVPTVVQIASAESSFRPSAINHNSNGSTDYGLMQINSVHGFDPKRLQSDPLYNMEAAKQVFDSQGWHAWTTYGGQAFNRAWALGQTAANTARGQSTIGRIQEVTAILAPFIGAAAASTEVAEGAGAAEGGGSGAVSGAAAGASAATKIAGTLTDAAALGSIAALLTSSQFWVRLGEALLGVLLLYLGLHALTGNSNSVGDQAKHVRRVFIPV